MCEGSWVYQTEESEEGSYRSCRFITVGPLFSRMDSSEWTPTISSSPSWRACSMAPAWPKLGVRCQISLLGLPNTGTWQRRFRAETEEEEKAS